MIYLFAGIGGMAGSILRFAISFLNVTGQMPYGTLFANLTGSFALGLLTSRWIIPGKINEHWASALSAGLLGSFTTFSAFSVEVAGLIREEKMVEAFFYFSISFGGGLLLAALGLSLGKWPLKGRGEM